MTTYQNEKGIFLTTNIWHSGQEIEYMLVTCHFVSDWKPHKRVLNFCRIPPPQNGPAICDVLNHCLMDWNLTNKLATITVDNALYNDVAIKKLKDVLSYQRKMPFDGKFFHVRCCAHIVNILVQEVLEEIRDIIHNIRETVKHVGESSHRIKLFGDVVKSWHLPGKKLILDCPTRWNSTYQMLACVLEFKDVFEDYEERDTDWIKVEKICSFLQVFNDITEILSGYGILIMTYIVSYSEPWLVKLMELVLQMLPAWLVNGITRGRRKFDDYIRGLDASQNSKSELNTYLEDGIIRLGDVNDYFDPLDWWKSNSLKFRTLSKLACDILAIPLTSVASESAFSAGSHVIDN
ncbi:hypothetical protein QQ045_032224 [Rhodiola kirilowii]